MRTTLLDRCCPPPHRRVTGGCDATLDPCSEVLMITDFVRSCEAKLRIWAAHSALGMAILASPIVAVAQAPALPPTGSIPAARLLVNGIVAPASDRAHASAVVASSKRTRIVIASSLLGAVVGGYVGYQQDRYDLCVDSPTFCHPSGKLALKLGAAGAVLGGITGLLISRF